MAFQHKNNSGTLFANDRRTAENQPNARGEAVIDGVVWEISAWTKTIQSGKRAGQKFQSLSFKPKAPAGEEPQL